jgi:hypothetical protein
MKRFITTAIALLAVNAYAEYNPNTPIIVQRAKAAVVYIELFDANLNKVGQATGWVARSHAGYEVVTNAHVVDKYEMRMTTLLGRRLYFDRWDGFNELADISIMRIKDDLQEPLANIALPISPGTADEGEHILVIGNPEDVTGTVSDGMVSAVRSQEFLITAPISPGSSGSPVLNDQGEVVGMVKAFFREGQNLNLCAPLGTIVGMLNAAGTEDQVDIRIDREISPPLSDTKLSWYSSSAKEAITDLVSTFLVYLENGKINPRHFAATVGQWYDKHQVSFNEIMLAMLKEKRRWMQEHTDYDFKHAHFTLLHNNGDYRNMRFDIPFTWTGIDRKGHTITKSDVIHVVIYESGARNGWYIEAVYNGDQGNW